MKSIKNLPKKKKGNKTIRRNTRKKMRGGLDNMNTVTSPPRVTKNNSKIRVQFLNPRTSTTPQSVISVTRGPTTGVFDYMWYNIDNIEEMLSTAMYGLKMDPPLPSEIVYNVIPNDKSDTIKEKPDETGVDESINDR
jgi:hypothetical protein